MKDRWLPVAVVAGVLFAVNAIARFIVWLAAPKSDATQIVIGLAVFGVVGVVMIWAGFRWGRRYPMSRVAPDLFMVVVASCLLSVVIGPLAGGSLPFREGVGLFFGEVWRYVLYAAAGAVLGLLVLTTLGMDYRSQALKRYAELKQAKPRRVVRR
ncbi:hypothetical protein [Rugosimonospora africana]|uniref:Uncharacterized protein n=1 Tax=Rugosimonospora africana TaxID=556532 RepID=A0A8J3QMF1_9ACTN|nr:hypothetical protein [Rugosimonospora africana]GIH12707.1 hypothetical protein Raf01_08790 [Rugosimonospora africana]